MSLLTGTPLGQITTQDDLYIDGAPNVFFQDDRANPLYNPDVDGFYWQLSGTVIYPVIALGCVDTVALADNLTMNDITCDTTGVKQTIMRRNSIDLTLNIATLFPLTTIRHILRGGVVTSSGGVEKMGLGVINNNIFFHAWLPKVYDEDTADYVGFQLHRARFVDAWTLGFTYGNAWKLTGIKLRAYANESYPADQRFATVIRLDPSLVP